MSVNVVVCEVEPVVAVIVTVEVPAGVPVLLPPLVELELPPHPADPRPAITTRLKQVRATHRSAGFVPLAANLNERSDRPHRIHRTATIKKGIAGNRCSLIGENIAALATVVIVSVVDTAEPLGVTVAGLNEQDANCGNPEHVKLVAAANPPDGVTVIVDVAELPAATVALAGLAAMAKSPDDAPPTVTVTAVDVEDANVPSPP